VRDRFLMVCALALGVWILSLPLLAHHGNTAFDSGKKITLKGTVTEWFWSNPHSILQFDVKDENGRVVHWVGESDNPPNLLNRGWSINSFKPGDQITVTLEPSKNGRQIGRVTQVVLANGKVLGDEREGAAPAGGAKGGSQSEDYPKQ
jgi:hypothetical protein